MFDLARWACGPLDGTQRTIAGARVSFKKLPLLERYTLAVRISNILGKNGLTIERLLNHEVASIVHELVSLSDAPDALFDDLSLLIPVAATAFEVNAAGLFDAPERMPLGKSSHRAVVKAFRKDAPLDGKKIAPSVDQYWFIMRPVYAGFCSYKEMLVDEVFTFSDIHRMHELLDLKQFNEIISHSQED